MKIILISIAAVIVISFAAFMPSVVHAQTPGAEPTVAESEPTGVDGSILTQIFRVIFGNKNDIPTVTPQPTAGVGTPSVTPAVSVTPGPSPTAGPTPVADPNSSCSTGSKGYYACKLVEEIKKNCGGKVTSANISCLNAIRMPGKPDAFLAPPIADAVANTGSNGLQCVIFAKMALYTMSNGDSQMLNSRGNAVDWFSKAPGTYVAISNGGGQKLLDGDVPIWNYDQYGHIAIYIGGGQIAEGNFDGGGTVNIRPLNESSPGLMGWLRLK